MSEISKAEKNKIDILKQQGNTKKIIHNGKEIEFRTHNAKTLYDQDSDIIIPTTSDTYAGISDLERLTGKNISSSFEKDVSVDDLLQDQQPVMDASSIKYPMMIIDLTTEEMKNTVSNMLQKRMVNIKTEEISKHNIIQIYFKIPNLVAALSEEDELLLSNNILNNEVQDMSDDIVEDEKVEEDNLGLDLGEVDWGSPEDKPQPKEVKEKHNPNKSKSSNNTNNSLMYLGEVNMDYELNNKLHKMGLNPIYLTAPKQLGRITQEEYFDPNEFIPHILEEDNKETNIDINLKSLDILPKNIVQPNLIKNNTKVRYDEQLKNEIEPSDTNDNNQDSLLDESFDFIESILENQHNPTDNNGIKESNQENKKEIEDDTIANDLTWLK